MIISQERLDRYSHFVSLTSTNGQYDPNRGLEALLSSITPDPKVAVLMAMAANRNEWIFTKGRLQRIISDELKRIGTSSDVYPITTQATWQYCERTYPEGDKTDGTLVDVGAVVKQVNIPTPVGDKTGYQISNAGVDLALPIGLAAVELVWAASQSGIEHKYDSMWRVLGFVGSPSESRRQIAVYEVVKYLVDNEGYHRALDIKKALEGKVNEATVTVVLASLGRSGFIDYDAPTKEVSGIKPSGFAPYRLAEKYSTRPQDLNAEENYRQMLRSDPSFARGLLLKIIAFIKEHPRQDYYFSVLANALGTGTRRISGMLTALTNAGILERVGEFTNETRSKARANGLTMMLYSSLLKPAWDSASTLTPYQIGVIDLDKKMRLFLSNYNDERSSIGPHEGKKIRSTILSILKADEDTKKDVIADTINRSRTTEIGREAINHHLKILIREGKVIKSSRGRYRLIDTQPGN